MTTKIAHVAPMSGDIARSPLSICIDHRLPADAPVSDFRPARDEIRELGKRFEGLPGVSSAFSDVTYTAWPTDGSVELSGHVTVWPEDYVQRKDVETTNARVPEILRELGYDVSVG